MASANANPAPDVPSQQEQKIDQILNTAAGSQTVPPSSTATANPSVSATQAAHASIEPEVKPAPTEPQTLAPKEPKLTETPFDMLLATKTLRLTALPHHEINKFRPSSLQMFRILHHMEELVCENPELLSVHPHYHPLLGRLYYSILFFIQIFRAMKSCGTLSPSLTLFIDQFLDAHPLETLPIAGPLVCFFQALSASRPSDDNYAYLIPVPSAHLGNRTRNAALVPNFPANWIQPHPHLIRAMIHNIYEADLQQPDDEWNPIPDFDELEQPTMLMGYQFAPDAPDFDRWCTALPDFMYPFECTNEQTYEFHAAGNILDIPPLPTEANVVSPIEQLAITTSLWFSQLCTIMTTHSKFFKNSGNLSQCSPIGNGSNLILNRVDYLKCGPYWNEPPTGLFSTTRLEPTPTSECRELEMPDLTQSYAFYSMLNTAFDETVPGPVAMVNFNVNFGLRGPYWQSDVVSTSGPNVYNNLLKMKIVSSYYDPDPYN